MTLAQLHRDPDLPRLALTLALVLLVQALLPLQSHTRMTAGADGIARQVCTLGGAPPDDPGHPGRDTPAMLFSQLAAELLPGTAGVAAPTLLAEVAVRAPAPVPATGQTPPPRTRIRAPPSA